MEIEAINRRVIGLDIHQAQIRACALFESDQGGLRKAHPQLGAFKRDLRALADGCAAIDPTEIVMGSTGIYWKSPYAALRRSA